MIYGYLRVSSDEQDVNNQRMGVIAFAKQREWNIDAYITDEGISGTKDPSKRALGKLLKRINKNDIIICSEISRLGRNLLMIMSILQHIMKKGAMLYTVKDNYILGDNIQSTVLAFAFGLAAQIERDMISMRTKEARQGKGLRGWYGGIEKGSGYGSTQSARPSVTTSSGHSTVGLIKPLSQKNAEFQSRHSTAILSTSGDSHPKNADVNVGKNMEFLDSRMQPISI